MWSRLGLRGRVPAEAVVFAVALAARLAVPAFGGGFTGSYGYDPSVYYAAADGLVHGRVPYRDFVLLHPPGLMLVLTPFAWLGSLVGDHVGFITASIAFTALGALNAALVVRVARRVGLSSRAALIGGLFYALWFGSVRSEFLTRLEPLGNLCALLGLLALLAGRDRSPARTHAATRGAGGAYAGWPLVALGGAAFGAATMIKIWWSAPLVAVLLWVLLDRRSWRMLAAAAGGAAAAMLLIGGPFFALAPRAMLSMVIQDQLGRPATYIARPRWGDLTSVDALAPHLTNTVALTAIVVVALGFAWLVVRSWQVRAARPVVAFGVLQLVVLLVSPTWFGYYTDFAAVGAALIVAAASDAPRRRRVVPTMWLPVAYVGALAAVSITVVPVPVVTPFPAAQFAAATQGMRCVQADSPMPLIQMNVLSRDFADGCLNWVDVTGLTYDGPYARPSLGHGRLGTRSSNERWQRHLQSYLLSGQALTIVRAHQTGIGLQLWHAIKQGQCIRRVDAFCLYRTYGGRPPPERPVHEHSTQERPAPERPPAT